MSEDWRMRLEEAEKPQVEALGSLLRAATAMVVLAADPNGDAKDRGNDASVLDIWKKRQRLEAAIEMSMSQLGEIAFKVFNGRDHQQEEKEQCKMKPATLVATVLTQGGHRRGKPRVRIPGKQNQKRPLQ